MSKRPARIGRQRSTADVPDDATRLPSVRHQRIARD